MKVVCESCQAKYQVPDERVFGKKLKIRCKRCGATVLIRGDLVGADTSQELHAVPVAPGVGDSGLGLPGLPILDNAAPDQVGQEWHASLDGDTQGPFSLEELRDWLASTPGGWDAHVWREGFSDWIEARACAELAPPPDSLPRLSPDDDVPTQTFHSQLEAGDAGQLLADISSAAQNQRRSSVAGYPAISNATSNGLRTRTSTGFANPLSESSPEVPSAGARRDSAFFSTPTPSSGSVSTSTSPSASASGGVAAVAGSTGFASGEGSGLIDIRALASLARQSQAQITNTGIPAVRDSNVNGTAATPAVESGYSFGTDESARQSTTGVPSAFARVESVPPVGHGHTSNAALPLAILGGCALVAAAVLAAVLFTRASKGVDSAAVDGANASSITNEVVAAADTATSPKPAEAQVVGGGAPASPAPPEAAASSAVKPASTVVTASGASGAAVSPAPAASVGVPAEKSNREEAVASVKKRAPRRSVPKANKEDKAQAAEADADEAEAASRAAVVAPPAPPEPGAGDEASSAEAEGDALASAKHASKSASSHRGAAQSLLDDAEAVATSEKLDSPKSAPAAVAPAAAGDDGLPEAPSSDETAAAMRSVESGVRACGNGDVSGGTAEVALTVSGATGRVSNATVSGLPPEVGSCIARAVRGARFPHFTRPSYSTKYSYNF